MTPWFVDALPASASSRFRLYHHLVGLCHELMLLPIFLNSLCARATSSRCASEGDSLVCPNEHRYRVVEGIPILLVSEAQQTHIEGDRALLVAEGDLSHAPLLKFNLAADEIDPFVRNTIGATNGGLYGHLVGNLNAYPIPDLRIPPERWRHCFLRLDVVGDDGRSPPPAKDIGWWGSILR